MEDKRKQGFSKKTKIALTKFIKSFEQPEIYGLPTENTEEQNKAVIRVLNNMFEFEGDTVVGFNEELIQQYYALNKLPTIRLL